MASTGRQRTAAGQDTHGFEIEIGGAPRRAGERDPGETADTAIVTDISAEAEAAARKDSKSASDAVVLPSITTPYEWKYAAGLRETGQLSLYLICREERHPN
jgi:hypothetical protein